jgi:type IV pilus assembly protein PilZ
MSKGSGEEKRAFPRIDAKIKVIFKNMGEFVEEYTKNISKGGMFLKTDKLLDPNAQIELMLTFPNQKKEHRILGKVSRLIVMSDPTNDEKQIYGVGIHFLKTDAEILKAIEELYNKHREK